jgi:hypothetical protein
MTAGPTEDATAAATQAKGESAARKHEADAVAQHQASGSAKVVEAAATPDDTSVSWFGSGTDAGQANVQPSTPPAVNSSERDPADPT